MKLKNKLLTGLVLASLAMPAINASNCRAYTWGHSDTRRALSSLTLAEVSNPDNSQTYAIGQSATRGATCNIDKTDLDPIVVAPGTELKFSAIGWTGEWMHSYFYIDYDKDGDYDSVLNRNGEGEGELVSYSAYSEDEKNWYNSAGQTVTNDSGVKAEGMPSFTLPANLEPGDYTCLFKIDWNYLGSCGRDAGQGNDIGDNGGVICEFKIRVENAEPEPEPEPGEPLEDGDRLLLYKYNENGSKFYRIPALVTAADGSIVCLADKRGDALGDLPNTISIVSKRSTDGGNTWSSMVTVAQGDASSNKSFGDAAVVLDTITNDLIAVFCGDNGFWNYPSSSPKQAVYMSKSSDNGQSWSTPVKISDQFNITSTWYGGFAGSGSMIQAKDGTIYFVLNTRLNSQWVYNQVYEYVVASTDHGTTWEVRNPSGRLPSDGMGNESKLVELSDGTLLMSIRTDAANKKRRFSKSTDGGRNWTPFTENADIVESGCNGDIIDYVNPEGQHVLLHSLPLDPAVRNRVGIYISFDNGETWPGKVQLCETYSAYSSMTVLDDNKIAIVYEEGKWDGNIPGDDGFQLYFQKFSYDWLIENAEMAQQPEPEVPEEMQDPEHYLTLDGRTQYMIIPKADSHNINVGDKITVSIKVKFNQTGQTGIIGNRVRDYSNRNNGNVSGWQLYTVPGTTSVSYNYPGSSWVAKHINYSANPATGDWHHYAWVYKGTSSDLYLDGELVASSDSHAEAQMPSLSDILVGAKFTMSDNTTFSYDALDSYLNGEVADIRIYKSEFTIDEVKKDRVSTSPLTDKSLIAAYDFKDVNIDKVPDISGNDNTATLVGYTTSASLTVSTVGSGSATVSSAIADGEPDGTVYTDIVPVGEEIYCVFTPEEDWEIDNVVIVNNSVSTSYTVGQLTHNDTAGTYYCTVTPAGDLSVTVTYTEVVADPVITLESVNATIGDDKVLTVTLAYTAENLPVDATVKAYITSDDVTDYSFEGEVSDGTGEFTFTEYEKGTYNVVIKALDGEDSEVAVSESKSYVVEKSSTSSLNTIEVQGTTEVRYYNLQGIEIQHPVQGNIYIRVADGQAIKVLVK